MTTPFPSEDSLARIEAGLGLASAGLSDDGLLGAVVAFVQRYVAMSEPQAVAVALWVLHTHAFAAAEATPYLSITSAEKESGKTRLLEVLELLVARPWLTSRVTAAVLARKVDAEGPTLLLDESDAAFNGEKDYAEALRGLLNTGHRRGGKSTVCVGQGATLSYRDFSTFGPKAIAGIGKLPDTVASRSIPVRLKRRAAGESVERFRRRLVAGKAEPLRNRAEAWARSWIEMLKTAEPSLPETLGDRTQDSWEPLLAIADLAGGEWPARARDAALELAGRSPEAEDSTGVRLLADVRALFDDQSTAALPSAAVLEALHALEDAPWGDWYGKPLTPQKLAKLLTPFGIRPKNLKTRDGSVRKGYERQQFEDSWRRYLAATPLLPAPGAGLRDFQAATDTPSVAALNGRSSALESRSSGLAPPEGGRAGFEGSQPRSMVPATEAEEDEAKRVRAKLVAWEEGP